MVIPFGSQEKSQSLIEAKKEMEKSGTSSLRRLWEIGKKHEKGRSREVPPVIRSDRRLG
jgi:hypothetical protein